MDTIKIEGSKEKLYLFTFIGLTGVVLGTWIAMSPETFVGTLFKNIYFIRIAGISAVLVFGAGSVAYIKEIFSEGFNLKITKEGIIDYANYYKVGMVRWEEVKSIKSASLFSEKYLCIYVKDPEKYINSKRGIKKFLLKRNFEMVGTPITISARGLKKCNHSELERIIMQAYEEYKTKENN